MLPVRDVTFFEIAWGVNRGLSLEAKHVFCSRVCVFLLSVTRTHMQLHFFIFGANTAPR